MLFNLMQTVTGGKTTAGGKTLSPKKAALEEARRGRVRARLLEAARQEGAAAMAAAGTGWDGLDEDRVDELRSYYGDNVVTQAGGPTILRRVVESFVNPFTLILIALAAVSVFTDIVLAPADEKSPVTVIIILTMVMISGLLRFIQELRSGNAAKKLTEMIQTTTNVQRIVEEDNIARTRRMEIPLNEVVVGDIVHLSAGDMVPADVRLLRTKDLFVSQAALTGESEALEKTPAAEPESEAPEDCAGLAFMGSNVISGSAVALVVGTGNDTLLGTITRAVEAADTETSFEKGVGAVSWVLIRFMLVMVPIVFVVNGLTKGNWMSSFLFAISIAVGLTPEMLPMIVTTCLAKGAVSMSKQKTIIKNLNSIQNFGAMDILCTDKTGTLTQDKVVLEYHLDVTGREDVRVLRHAFLNSYFQTGLKNLMDIAIIERTGEESAEAGLAHDLAEKYEKVDEIPFDFTRRRMSVVVADGSGKTQMITKGAVEEMLSVCAHVEYKGAIAPLDEEIAGEILATVDGLNDDGMRVIAVAQKTNPSPVGAFSVADEADMVLMGYLAFLDPPKESTEAAIRALKDYGVGVKVLTGDNDRVTRTICRQVGLPVQSMLLGADVEKMDDGQLARAVEETSVFAKLAPDQKSRIVRLLRENGHTVGFMGDGINDAAAMKESDVGISVDTAVDIAKESADVVLLEKDLMVLENGIIEGRKTYANMIKYIKMTASSNFGNVFSVLVASAFLPFLPMMSIHLILLNLIYDLTCTAIPWDNVDDEFLHEPRRWDASSISSFMLWIGPCSSVFDILTYLLLYFVVCPLAMGGFSFRELGDMPLFALLGGQAPQERFEAVFQAGWFVMSMWSQTLVIHTIRTRKIPFVQSRASFPVIALSILGIAALTVIPFTPLGTLIGLAPLPAVFFAYLAVILVAYMALVTVVKRLYIKRHGVWL